MVWVGYFVAQLPVAMAGEVGVDEAVQVAVHDGVDVAGLIAGAGVLHQRDRA